MKCENEGRQQSELGRLEMKGSEHARVLGVLQYTLCTTGTTIYVGSTRVCVKGVSGVRKAHIVG